MRLTLLGFNVIALGALTAPAFLIFQSVSKAGAMSDQVRFAYLAALAVGAVCLFAAMSRLSAKRAEPAQAISLMLLGGSLFAAPLVIMLLG